MVQLQTKVLKVLLEGLLFAFRHASQDCRDARTVRSAVLSWKLAAALPTTVTPKSYIRGFVMSIPEMDR